MGKWKEIIVNEQRQPGTFDKIFLTMTWFSIGLQIIVANFTSSIAHTYSHASI